MPKNKVINSTLIVKESVYFSRDEIEELIKNASGLTGEMKVEFEINYASITGVFVTSRSETNVLEKEEI